MARITKRQKEFAKVVDKEKFYTLDEAIAQVEKFPAVKFDETVELHLMLNLGTKAADLSIRGTVVLPNGTGKKVRVAVFCKGELVQKAEQMGADFVGSNDLIEKVANGFMDFDCVIATPDMMRDLSKLGKILGPRGLMPSPKAGTVTQDIGRVLNEIKAGRVEFKADKQAGIHVGVGKRSFAQDKLLANAKVLLDAVNQAKPAAVKGNFIKSITVSTTMGPGVKVAVA